MTKTYFSVLTQYGEALFTQSLANHQPINIIQMAVGDGNGQAVIPNSTQTRLVHEVHRANVSAVIQDPINHSQVIFELTIPENIGGFTIREIGIFDNRNKLVAVANTPETYKPRLDEGSAKVQVLRMVLKLSSSEQVTLTVDDSVIFATKGQLTPKTLTANTRNIVDDNGHSHQIDEASTSRKGIVQLVDNVTTDDNTKALTARQGLSLKRFIDVLTRSLSNYITNSKKSSAVNSNSEDTIATSKAVKTAYDKSVDALSVANSANNNANNRIHNNKKSSAINSNSEDTVATSKAVKTAYDKSVDALNVANTKQSPSSTLAGYGINNFKIEHYRGDLNNLRTDGHYFIGSTSEVSNLPVGAVTGNIIVNGGGYSNTCYQILYEHYSGRIFERHQTHHERNQWSDWKLANPEIKIIKGEIGNGGTLPLPSGFNQEECKWIVTISNATDNNQGYMSDFEVSVNEQRVVTAKTYTRSFGWNNSNASYLVIGVK